MKIGFTGTQDGMTAKQKEVLRWVLANRQNPEEEDEFHHGDCIGADAEADAIAHELGIKVIIHPPIEKAKRAWCQGAYMVLRPKPYLERNHDIVDATEMLIATPKQENEVRRSGTWATIRYARGVPVSDVGIITPEGFIHLE